MSESGRHMWLVLLVAGFISTGALADEPSRTARQNADAIKSDSRAKPVPDTAIQPQRKPDLTPGRGAMSSEKVAGLRNSLALASKEPCAGQPEAARRDMQELDSRLQRLQQSVKGYEMLKARREPAASRGEDTSRLDTARLSAEIKKIEREAEEARNQAQRASTHFNSAEQKCNQMLHLLNTSIRNLEDIRLSAVRGVGL